MNRSILVSIVTLSMFAACGPDAMAVVGDDGDLDGTESYDAELTSTSRSSTWFPLQNGNSWTFKNTAGATRTVSEPCAETRVTRIVVPVFGTSTPTQPGW